VTIQQPSMSGAIGRSGSNGKRPGFISCTCHVP
jgi:hypothetical protein